MRRPARAVRTARRSALRGRPGVSRDGRRHGPPCRRSFCGMRAATYSPAAPAARMCRGLGPARKSAQGAARRRSRRAGSARAGYARRTGGDPEGGACRRAGGGGGRGGSGFPAFAPAAECPCAGAMRQAARAPSTAAESTPKFGRSAALIPLRRPCAAGRAAPGVARSFRPFDAAQAPARQSESRCAACPRPRKKSGRGSRRGAGAACANTGRRRGAGAAARG